MLRRHGATTLRRAVLVGVLAMLVGMLGGCSGGDPEPKVAEPTASVTLDPSESGSESASPTALGPGDPVEVVESWINAQNLALRSGDTSALRALAAQGCRGCDEFSDGIDKIFRAGGHFEGGEWTFVRGKVEDATARPIRVNAGVRIASGSTVPASGAAPRDYEASSRLMVFELSDDTGSWLISLIGSLS